MKNVNGGMNMRLPMDVKLKNGANAAISFLGTKDSVRELRQYINTLVDEDTYLLVDRKVSLREEAEWKKGQIAMRRKGDGYVLVARVGGKLAGTASARRGIGKERDNIFLGIALLKPFRGIGLGEALMRTNIAVAKGLFAPKNIWLCVFAPNKTAMGLYKKLGFRKFAVYPGWIAHRGGYVDDICMKL